MAGKGVRRGAHGGDEDRVGEGSPGAEGEPVPGPELSRYRRKPAAARSLHVGSPGQKQALS